MEQNDWKQILKEQQHQLSQILSDCQNSSDELALLVSKMSPLLEELSHHTNVLTEELGNSSANDTKPPDEM